MDIYICWSQRHPPNVLGGCIMIIDFDPQPDISVTAIIDHYISYIYITIGRGPVMTLVHPPPPHILANLYVF